MNLLKNRIAWLKVLVRVGAEETNSDWEAEL